MNGPNGAPRTPPPSAAAALPALSLSVAAAAGALDRAAIAAVVESLRADLWLTDARLGGLLAATVLAGVVLAPALARLAARWTPSRALAAGVAVGALGTLLSGAARRGIAILGARLAAGAGPAARAGAPASQAAAPAAPLAGAALGGAAAGYALGAALSRLVGWRWALVAAAIPGLVAAIACLRRGASGAAPSAPLPLPLRGDGGVLAELRRLRADRPRLLAVVGQGAATLAAGAMAFWTPAFLERTRGVPRSIAGVAFALVVLVAGVGGARAGARAIERLRGRRAAAEAWVAGAAALAAAPLALAAYAAWRPRAFLPALLLAQLLTFAAARAGAAAVAGGAPAAGAERAIAAAAVALAVLAEAPGPAIVGFLSDRTSLGRALAVAVPVALAIAAAAWLALAYSAGRAARDRGGRLARPPGPASAPVPTGREDRQGMP